MAGHGPRAGVGWRSAGAVLVLGVLTGCGSSASGTPPAAPAPSAVSPVASVPCTDARLALERGRTLRITGCPPAAEAEVTAGDAALERVGAWAFTGRTAGQATVEINTGPPCTPGARCSHLRVHRATLVITVR